MSARLALDALIWAARAITGTLGLLMLAAVAGLIDGDFRPAWFAVVVGLALLVSSFSDLFARKQAQS